MIYEVDISRFIFRGITKLKKKFKRTAATAVTTSSLSFKDGSAIYAKRAPRSMLRGLRDLC